MNKTKTELIKRSDLDYGLDIEIIATTKQCNNNRVKPTTKNKANDQEPQEEQHE